MFNYCSKKLFPQNRFIFQNGSSQSVSGSKESVAKKAKEVPKQKPTNKKTIDKNEKNEGMPTFKNIERLVEKNIKINLEKLKRLRAKAKAKIIDKAREEQQRLKGRVESVLLPVLSKTPDAIKIDTQAKTAKINETRGTIEEPFKSQNGKIEGSVSLPLKANPDQRTTIVVHFCAKPNEVDPKFLDNLAKQKKKFSNTIIINLKTPNGATIEVNNKKIDAMRAIISATEKYQNEYYKNSTNKLPRALSILPFTDPDQAQKALIFIKEAGKNAQLEKHDPRLIKLNIYNTDQFNKELPQILKDINNPFYKIKHKSDKPLLKPRIRSSIPKSLTIPHRVPKNYSKSAGKIPGRVLSQHPDKKPQDSVSVKPPQIPSSHPNNTPKPPNKLTLSETSVPIYGKTGFFGDSILNQFNHHNYKWNMPQGWMKKAYSGKTSAYLLHKLKKSNPADFKGLKQAVILIGTNDIGNINDKRYTAEAIEKRIKTIYEFFLSKGIRVFACTIPPFKGHTYSNYGSQYEKVNAKRKEINDFIRNDQDVTIIPLDNTENTGGIASNSDPNRMSKDYKPKGGWLHPKPKLLARLIENNLKRDLNNSAATNPTTTPLQLKSKSQLKPYPYSVALGKFATQQNKRFITEGRPFGYTEKSKFHGENVLLKYKLHHRKGATGATGDFAATEVWRIV